ncbi:Monooxygenase FAD-binding [Penicillium cf. griseofulvum]|nr:Monooxygenase FAD-binding [Penicillium cf. griseofulvum]
MVPFTVIIIGGSVAGLTLANVLERYGIEYILLEKYKVIAPQLGASIGILPYGLQVLDQLGIAEQISSVCEVVETMQTFGPDGECLNTMDTFGQLVADLTGYKLSFLDRRDLIQALYNNLQDKSKVHMSKEIFKIDQLNGEVQITTKDNVTFRGDLLVGADGVHSRTRAEMWRIAELENPQYGSKQMRESITCTYKCMFGIADNLDGISKETGFKSYHKNRSYLCQSGHEGKFYFFVFIKNKQKTVDQSIPRYTAEDEQAVVDEYGEDIIRPGITFGDVYKRRRHAVLVPLHEYYVHHCIYGEGTANHDYSSTPLTGQGGNSAIEDAALLGDLLKEALQTEPCPTSATLQVAFADFQQQRRPRTKFLLEGASGLQALEALENPFLKLMALKVVGKMSVDQLAPLFAECHSPGHILRYLPEPSHRGVVARDADIAATPDQRALPATILWATIIAATASLSLFAVRYISLGSQNAVLGNMLQFYTFIIRAVVNVLWTVESYRPGLFSGPLHSAIPYLLFCTGVGWEFVLPIYFLVYIWASRSRPFYYPAPRAIDIRAAENLPAGILIAYIPSILWALVSSHGVWAAINWPFAASHLAFPVVIHLGLTLSRHDPPKSNIPESLYGKRDLPHLIKTYNILIFITATLHILILCQLGLLDLTTGSVAAVAFSYEGVQLMVLSLVIMVWCFFITWDLRRVRILQTHWLSDMSCYFMAGLFLGPAATLISMWKAREVAMEDSRRRR